MLSYFALIEPFPPRVLESCKSPTRFLKMFEEAAQREPGAQQGNRNAVAVETNVDMHTFVLRTHLTDPPETASKPASPACGKPPRRGTSAQSDGS
jgi:hypothetical protein